MRSDPLREEHLPMLGDWLRRPHVAQWWKPPPPFEDVRRAYIDGLDEPGDGLGRRPPTSAIRCYAAVGFRRVGPITTPDGAALLMRCTRETLS